MSKTDNYARHEVLHMSLFLSEAVHEQLTSHQAIQGKPEWKALAEQAHLTLFDLYQAIGAEHLSKN